MSDEDAVRARLLAHYEQKEGEFLAKAERLRTSMPGMTANEELKATIYLARLTYLVEENREKAARLRDTLPG
jgi:hypothetical protein